MNELNCGQGEQNAGPEKKKKYLENSEENFSCGCIGFGGICCIFRSLFICLT